MRGVLLLQQITWIAPNVKIVPHEDVKERTESVMELFLTMCRFMYQSYGCSSGISSVTTPVQ